MEEKKKIRRSRNGCHNCKRLKIKCDERKPTCSYCIKTNAQCDYSIKLTWGGRPYKVKKKEKQHSFQSVPIPTTSSVDSVISNKSKKEEPANGGVHQQGLNNDIQFILHDFTSPLVTSPLSPTESLITQPELFGYSNNKKRKASDCNNENLRKRDKSIGDAVYNTETQSTFLAPQMSSSFVSEEDKLHFLKMFDKKTKSESPLQEMIPEIKNGMNQLTNALADIGFEQFQLENSDIFNEFIQNPENYNKITHLDSNSESLENSFLNNYSEDITRIEKYLPRQPTNIFGDNTPMRLLSNFSRTPKIQELEFDDDEEEPTDQEYWESIPPLLVPLPTLLLNVPFYRNLMHFWINVAANHLVPASSRIYSDNPFKILLTQMAMEYPSILNTLLAFSAKMRSNLIGKDDTPDTIIDQLLSRSCSELLRLLKNKESATSDQTLATAMLLSCFEVFNSKDFSRHRAHNIGARQIIKARSTSQTRVRNPDAGTEKDMTFFLMRWFVYTDVIGALSSTTNSRDYLLTSGDSSTYEPLESITMLSDIDNMRNDEYKCPKNNIDYLMGFDIKFLPQFAKITMLIREVNMLLQQSREISPNIPLSIVHKALEVKEALLQTRKLDEEQVMKHHEQLMELKIKRKRGLDLPNPDSPEEVINLIQENDILRYTNKIFCDAGLIHLYRRVLLLPRESKLVQDLAMGIGELAKTQIESRSPAEICCIFCFFTAGCEVLNPNMQQFFQLRFQNLAEMGNTNARKGLEIMKRCWQTNEDWITAAKVLDLDLTLL